MACKTVTQPIKLEAANLYWGREACRQVTLVDDVAGSLSGEYFYLDSKDIDGNSTEYYVLLDNGSAVDPTPTGKTKIPVSYTDGDDAATLAGLMQTAVDAIDGFNASVESSTQVHIENKYIGEVVDGDRSNAPSLTFSDDSGIGGFLGKTSEGIELAIETQSTEIQANQTGLLVTDEIFQGQTASLTAAFLELTKDRLKSIIAGAVGGSYTPSGGTELVGGGDSRLFQSLKQVGGGKLILNPIRLGSSDRSEDVIFWISAPKPESINYSGTDVQVLNCTFTAYLDESKPSAVRLYAFGDWSQDEFIG
jgi:hypothetical protein